MNRVELPSFLVAVAIHVGVGYVIFSMPPPPPVGPKTVEFEIKKPPPPPVEVKKEEEKPPEEKPPEKKVIPKVKLAPPPDAPKPNKTAEPPKEPPKPVFGLNMDSVTDGPSDVAMPVGNTTMMDPKKSKIASGPVEPLPQAPPAPPKPSYNPVSDLYVKTLPEIDGEACGNSVKYPEDALAAGIEGTVTLRIELDETGKVHAIKVLKGLGHGLDEYAVHTMKTRPECRFKAAIATDGKAVPYVIRNYAFRFELPR